MATRPSFQAQSTSHDPHRAWSHQLHGKFVGLAECYDFLEEAREKVDDDHPSAILDMAGVTMINSTGIGMLAALLTTVQKRGGKLVLVGLGETTRRQLEVTHVLPFLTVVGSMEEATAALR